MNFLLDTCTFLWLELSPHKVPASVVRAVGDRSNRCLLSAASAWEIAVKWSAGKLTLPSPPDEFVAKTRAGSDVESLPIFESMAVQVAKLPRHHSDPFDRILVSQAIDAGLIIATPDPLIRQYAVRTIWD